jgi:hypothetical protein
MGWGPKAPDMSGVNAAAQTNAEIAREQLALGREQFADAQQRQAVFDPKFAAIIDQSLESQRTQDARSQQQWDQYLEIGLPAERKLAETAMNYDTAGRRAEAGAAARAAVETESNMQREAQQRMLGRSGVSLSSGRSLALDNSTRLATARASAGADRAARREVEATGLSLVDNTAKLGRGIAGTGLQAASLALGAGGTAQGALQGQQGTYNASLTPGMSLYQGATGANTASGNLYANAANIQANNQSGGLGALMGLGQTAGILYGSGMFASSKKLKRPVKGKAPKAAPKASAPMRDSMSLALSPAADAVERSAPREGWQYDGNASLALGDNAVHVGPYAEDVQASMGDDVAPGGEAIDMDKIGLINHKAIAELDARFSAVERQLGIA